MAIAHASFRTCARACRSVRRVRLFGQLRAGIEFGRTCVPSERALGSMDGKEMHILTEDQPHTSTLRRPGQVKSMNYRFAHQGGGHGRDGYISARHTAFVRCIRADATVLAEAAVRQRCALRSSRCAVANSCRESRIGGQVGARLPSAAVSGASIHDQDLDLHAQPPLSSKPPSNASDCVCKSPSLLATSKQARSAVVQAKKRASV
jgi:hypothetical protein